MDPTTRLTQLLIQDCLPNRGRQQQQQQPTLSEHAAPPPPYSEEADSDSETTDDDDDDDNDDEEPTVCSPVNLTINAAHSIQGSNNLIPTSSSASPLADASKFSTLLLHAINHINGLQSYPAASNTKPRRRRPLKVTINCGLTVVGDRNVIGNIGLKPRNSSGVVAATPKPMPIVAAVAGAKRKADDPLESAEGGDEQPAQKRVAVGGGEA